MGGKVSFDFTGQVALVTGASRGIGRGIALNLGEAGAWVGVNYKSNRLKAEELCDQIESAGGKALPLEADVTDEAQVNSMVATVLKEWGKIDYLVNNAGNNEPNFAVRMDEEVWDRTIDTHLKGTWLCSRAVLRDAMSKQRSGVQVTISSVINLKGYSGQAPYAAAKSGQLGLVRTIAKEGARRGVRAVVISPGVIDTDIWTATPESVQQDLMGRVLVDPKLGTPDDVAWAVLFALSDQARYLNGCEIIVDGGLTIN